MYCEFVIYETIILTLNQYKFIPEVLCPTTIRIYF